MKHAKKDMVRDDAPPYDNDAEDVIMVRQRAIPVRNALLDQSTLRFYPENPRIYSVVWKEEGVQPTQHDMFDALSKMEHVREVLVPSIRQHGGLLEAVLVKGKVVLEGNSRLAAYRLLAQTDAEKWKYIRARILPDSMTESEIFTLLGEFHIVGKKDWQKYEQANYLYRRFTLHKVPEDELKVEVGLSAGKIRHYIRTIEFMLTHNDATPVRWSFYDELLKGSRFNNARELYPKFDETIVEKIQSEEIRRAVDLRDQLPLITKAGGNTLKKFMSGAYSFSDAIEHARLRGANDGNFKKINQFRQWLVEDTLDAELADAPADEKKRISFEFEKIERRLKSVMRHVKKKA